VEHFPLTRSGRKKKGEKKKKSKQYWDSRRNRLGAVILGLSVWKIAPHGERKR